MNETATRRVELFVRSLSPDPARNPANDHLPRLRTLADRGRVDLTVSVWGREVGLSQTATTGPGSHVLERVADFRGWADEYGVSLTPFFREREVDSGLTGESYAALVLPAACLAEYRDGNLTAVTPHAADSTVRSVRDHVDWLETTDDGDRPSPSAPLVVGSH